MSIFKIQQQALNGIEAVPKANLTPVPPADNTPSDQPNKVVDENEIKAELVQLGEEKPPEKANKKEGEVVVNIAGSLSSVFTASLNQLLATESYMTMIPMLGDDEGKGLPVHSSTDILRVYCWDGDALNMQDVVQITNEIARSSSEDEFVIAIENMKNPSIAIGAAARLNSLKNVSVCYTRGKALQLVKDKVSR